MDCVAAVTLDHILRNTAASMPKSLASSCWTKASSSWHSSSSSVSSISARYFTLLQSRFQEIWFVHKSLDYQRKSCISSLGEHKNSWMYKFARFYYRRLIMLAQRDRQVHQMLFKVLGMEENSWVLFTPDMILKVYGCQESKPPPRQKQTTKSASPSSSSANLRSSDQGDIRNDGKVKTS